jgi:hypothetical protein
MQTILLGGLIVLLFAAVRRRWLLAAAGLGLSLVSGLWVVLSPVPRGPDEVAVGEVLATLALLVAGMFSKVLFDAIERRERFEDGTRGPMRLDRWEFVRPMLVGVLVFGCFWQAYGNEQWSVQYGVIAFQNGFFWQTVLEPKSD